ncbi:pterin 4 alpha carbinolamine dehydratase-domain-containing protein [Copromyces sp. CBS 386.78]|nr:pterin 4 alpha carbinolamine dehydratase-domain-containing protein [Copromyces sp. CBS 386.78]
MSFTLTRTPKPSTLLTKLINLNHPTRNFSIFIQTSNRSTTPKITSITTSTTNFYHQHQQKQQHHWSLHQQSRNMSSSSSSEIKAQFSEGSDPTVLGPSLEKLLAAGGGKWTLTQEGVAIERTFKFKTFAKTWDFMTAVSLQCKLKNHHPEWSNVFNTTFIRWTTHVPKGLSSKDIELAAICDSLAKDFGETEPTESCAMPNLADRAVASSGDCCTPKHLKK